MPEAIEILAFHGWGFDSSCWDGLERALPSGTSLVRADRGYFGNPFSVGWSRADAGRRILVLHSMAPLFAGDLIAGADVVVLVSSFVRLGSGRVMRRMVSRLAADPASVLSEFHENCALPAANRPVAREGPDPGSLERDLELLETGQAPVGELARVPERTVVHGSEDRIADPALGRELADGLGPGATFRLVRGAGHALLVTHPEVILDSLVPVPHPR